MRFLLLAVPLIVLGQHPTLPNPSLTPGKTDPAVTQATIQKTICKKNYTKSVRNVTEAEKKEIMKRYNLPETELHNVEIDHFISLDIGGSNDIENLWPQYYEPEPGARQKDVVETYFHRQICKGKVELFSAQIQMKNWVSIYQQIHKAK